MWKLPEVGDREAEAILVSAFALGTEFVGMGLAYRGMVSERMIHIGCIRARPSSVTARRTVPGRNAETGEQARSWVVCCKMGLQ